MGESFGHACGLRVDGVQREKVLKMDRPFRAGGFLSLTALRAEGCGLPLCGNAYKVSVTGFAFSVIGLAWHSGDWLATLAPLSGCAGLPPQAVAEQPVLKVE